MPEPPPPLRPFRQDPNPWTAQKINAPEPPQKPPKIRVSTPHRPSNATKPPSPLPISFPPTWHSYPRPRTKLVSRTTKATAQTSRSLRESSISGGVLCHLTSLESAGYTQKSLLSGGVLCHLTPLLRTLTGKNRGPGGGGPPPPRQTPAGHDREPGRKNLRKTHHAPVGGTR
jgi:hypothetical protein